MGTCGKTKPDLRLSWRFSEVLVTQDKFKIWARTTFADYRGSVAYIATIDDNGDEGIGTAFHVGNGVFVTARHVLEGRAVKEIGFDDESLLFTLNKQAALAKSLTHPREARGQV
jgi:hypothetical protein